MVSSIKEEITEFQKPDSGRAWPDIWIVATNIDPSGAPETGAFDAARALVRKARPSLANRFHIWGGSKIIAWLQQYGDVASAYGHFLTPGHILTEIRNALADERASIDDVVRTLIVDQFGEQEHTKLEQAGSTTDARPGVHDLFVDIPYRVSELDVRGYALDTLMKAAAKPHRPASSAIPDDPEWRDWHQHPDRAGVLFIRGGPGQGKSTSACPHKCISGLVTAGLSV